MANRDTTTLAPTDTQPVATGMVMPSEAALAAARATADKARIADDDGPRPGRVLDLDYDKWAAAIVDLSDKPDRVESARRRFASKGYVKVGGSPTVVGFPSAEVWVKSRADYESAIAARHERIGRLIEQGVMSETAHAVETIKQPKRQRR